MSTAITTIQSSDLITNSRAVINDNFASLNTNKIETSVLDTDISLAANSDAKIPSQKAVKSYVDSGGNPNASTTQKGIVEIATDAEVASRSTTGSTGAMLVVAPSSLPPAANDFGTGSDGTVTLDGVNTYAFFTKVSNTYTLTRDIFVTSLTVNSGITLVENGYAIYGKISIINAGTIHNSATNASTFTHGVGGAGGTFTAGPNGQDGTTQGAGAAGTAKTGAGSAGSAGGNAPASGYNGGAGGTLTAETLVFKPVVTSGNLTAGVELSVTELYRLIASTNGAALSGSSGSGAGAGSNNGKGGGSGGTGGVVFLAAPTITNTGTIASNGGNGGNGLSVGGFFGGGGAGGAGGIVCLIYKTLTAGTITVNGGSKGLSGGGTSTDGADGLAGKIYKVKVTDTVIA